ncbi:hypothetical protein FRC03_010184 [Tulasnella sp. 419]|nr:hypothetical protein FRC03_010184 [Tulasnella sp. 419]
MEPSPLADMVQECTSLTESITQLCGNIWGTRADADELDKPNFIKFNSKPNGARFSNSYVTMASSSAQTTPNALRPFHTRITVPNAFQRIHTTYLIGPLEIAGSIKATLRSSHIFDISTRFVALQAIQQASAFETWTTVKDEEDRKLRRSMKFRPTTVDNFHMLLAYEIKTADSEKRFIDTWLLSSNCSNC